MVKCNKCGTENIDEAIFCADCGSVLPKNGETSKKLVKKQKSVVNDKDVLKSDINVDDVIFKTKKRIRITVASVIVIIVLTVAVVLIVNPSLLRHSNKKTGYQQLPDSTYEENTEEQTTVTKKNTYISDIQSDSVLNVDGVFVGETLSISEETVCERNGYVSESNQAANYSYTAPRDGKYRIEVENLIAGNSVRIQLLDSNGEKIDSSTYGYLNAQLSGGDTYEIQILYIGSDNDFLLKIYQQKPTVDISASTEIIDQVSYEGQRNIYTFTPSLEGRYRFDLTEVKSGISFKITVKDNFENVIDTTLSGGLFVTLEPDKTYTVLVSQNSDIGSYKMKIGFQKKTNNISEYTVVCDSIEYTDQKNIYKFTPVTDGIYRFELTEVNANNKFKLMAWDEFENNIGDTTSNGLTLKLESGKEYQIQVRYYSGLGTYKMVIGSQKSPVDVSQYNSISDSITYVDQENIYYYVPRANGEYIFTLKILNADSSVIMRIYDNYDYEVLNTRGKACVNLESGKKYKIVIKQYSGKTGYELSMEMDDNY